MIRRHVTLTQELAALVRRDDRFEIVAPHPLNLLCVSLVAGDAATDDLIERANATGEVLFTRTVLDGRSVLRFSIGGADDRAAPRAGRLEPAQRSGAQQLHDDRRGGAPHRLVVELEEVQQPIGRRRAPPLAAVGVGPGELGERHPQHAVDLADWPAAASTGAARLATTGTM